MDTPNILFIFPDQLGAAWMGAYGNPVVQTPNLDRFAAQGILFENAYTACPLCTPYRGTLFTGRYPCQTGITDNNYRIPSDEIKLPELLNQAGYYTSYIGKWHLSGQGKEKVGGNVGPGGGKRWIPFEDRAGFRQFLGWESGHVDHWQGVIWEDDPDQVIEMPGHETDALTDMVIERLEALRDRDTGQPFCLFVAYQAPHPPCSPPDEYLQLYKSEKLPDRPNINELNIQYQVGIWDFDPTWREFVDSYFAEITHLDAAIGRVLGKLDELGLSENTIVLFTSDHGEMAGAHGLFGKGAMYEESLHVPLIVRAPNGPQGLRSEHLFSSVDFFPTLLELCGAPAAPSAEGLSYAPFIRGQVQEVRESVMIEHDELCIRQGNFKLITDIHARSPIQFFNLETDPYEMKNLVRDAAYQDLITELLARLQTWLDDVLQRVGIVGEASLLLPPVESSA